MGHLRNGFWFLKALLWISCASQASSQIITTIAGTAWSFPATPLPATKAPIGSLTGVAIDAGGNTYLADNKNCMVFRVSPDGSLSVAAGNGTSGYSGDGGAATSAALCPAGLAVDTAGNLYVADASTSRVRKVSPAGIITTVAGNGSSVSSGDGGSATAAGLANPHVIAVDRLGNLYITTNDSIREVTPSGTITTVVRDASLIDSSALTVDAGGNLFYGLFSQLLKVTPGGTPVAVPAVAVGFPGIGDLTLTGLTFDVAGNLYISGVKFDGIICGCSVAARVLRLDTSGKVSTVAGNGTIGYAGDGGPAVAASLKSPCCVAVDSQSTVYFADTVFLRRVTPDGVISTVAGNGEFRFSGDGGPALNAVLGIGVPTRIARDTEGNLYVAGGDRVRKIAPSGTISTVAGGCQQNCSGAGGPATNFQLTGITAFTVDAAGNLYIADAGTYLYRVTPDGVISIVEGSSNFNSFNARDLTTDAAGNLYIANGGLVQKRSPNGFTSTVAGCFGPIGGSCAIAPATGDGGPATNARIDNAGALAFDATGNLAIVDGCVVRLVATNGVITTIAGSRGTNGYSQCGYSGDGGPATSAQLGVATALAVDRAGNVIVADGLYTVDFQQVASNRIRKITTGGIITTIAGNGSPGHSGDGGPAVNAAINEPTGLASDPTDNLYIAETVATPNPFVFDPSGATRVRLVLASPPQVQAVPTQLSFSGVSGGAPTPAQSLSITSSVPGVSFTLSISQGLSHWLSVNPASGTTPRVLDVIADPGSLAPGVYQATITLSAPTANPSGTTIDVTFTVGPAIAPSLSLDTRNLSFTFPRSGAAQSQNIVVSNAGSGRLDFTATATTAPTGPFFFGSPPTRTWLTVSPASGTVTPAGPVSLSVTADPTGLFPGTYSGVVTVNSANGTASVTVQMTISALDQAILVSPGRLSFLAVVEGGMAPAQTFPVSSLGAQAVAWTVSTSTLSAVRIGCTQRKRHGEFRRASALGDALTRASFLVPDVEAAVTHRIAI